MAAWSGFRSTSECSGWSPRGGQLKGIFYPGMKVSGSSGGCAVAVALGLCAAGIGTETCWSVVLPAERSGIVGFKPTRGLIPSEGIAHASLRLDTVGVLARTVRERQIILDTGMKVAINTYLASLATNPNTINDVQDLIDFTKACAEEKYPARNVVGFERAAATSPDKPLYLKMMAREEHFTTGPGSIAAAFKKHKCSVMLVPALSPTLQPLAAKAGSPVLSIPMGVYPAGTEVTKDAGNGLVKGLGLDRSHTARCSIPLHMSDIKQWLQNVQQRFVFGDCQASRFSQWPDGQRT
ncbi:amidase signature enzyme [Setomelanomma holmii]|uniref:Amidase signature enzyme n=1 Tax=Setomelanomma holmii TaxID=210430 RepID=A0A9P4LJ70_9PLEO|nr:amidase signature enzyme [Setomelanomma holmii]